ncbi:putative nonsense mRNA reducing factor 1 [Trypanosoma rangeli]|uniref:Putative nonsense mRNA reducing factor 1 n=1 Tax=Trypanosoma rangeli TaxID=5698 RepID=A0A3R7KP82_TRYRA|nr:putative nonsense mRNA reducing factor 1 [Trypanosoma rangeli]RNF10901.1 putative nonsense mRNA reducing factor 1 [Trypanosoma rangeli]|eukprot:RNF10901.1 putative nonsense mRNA reducing factor 1 [Trypanosoma rangeli]
MQGAQDALPCLVGSEVVAYVRFLLEWTDATPLTTTGQVHHRLVTLGTGEEEVQLLRTLKSEQLPALVEQISAGIARGEARAACPVVVRDAVKHVMSDGCASGSRSHRVSSVRQPATAEKLLAVARSTQYRGPLVLLIFHPNDAVSIWSRETLLRLVNLAASSSAEAPAAANDVWLLGMQLLCTIKHVTCAPLDLQEEGTKRLVADGCCSLLAVLTALDAKLAELERAILQAAAAAGEKISSLFGGVSSATVLLLGGSMLLDWLISTGPAKSTPTTSVTNELAVVLNAQLGVNTTLQPASLASDTQRALVKVLVHCLLDNAKRAATASREGALWCARRMRELWCVASHIDPPPPTTARTKLPVNGALRSPPAKSAGWLLRFLMRNASVQLNMQTALRGATGGAPSDATFHTMEVAVHALRSLLTTLADTLPELATSCYYHEFLRFIQKDCLTLMAAISMRSQEPYIALMVLRHFLLTDLVLFGSGGASNPGECLRPAWEMLPELLQRTIIWHSDKAASASSCSPLLLLRVLEVLDVTMEKSSACAWLFLKPLKDGPQPLAWVVSKCMERLTNTVRGSMKEMRQQWEEAMMAGGNISTGTSRGVSHTCDNNSNTYYGYGDGEVNYSPCQGNKSSVVASRLLSSGSSIPRLAHVLMLSTDTVTRRLGEAISAIFLRCFSSVVHNTFRADAANWLLQVILHDPVLQESKLKLHDAKVDAVVRASGATWVTVMCSCNWSNLSPDILATSWWLCALLADVCVLETPLGDQLLDLVVTQLPSLTGAAPVDMRLVNPTAATAAVVAPATENEAISSHSLQSLRQCAQHLLLVLLQRCSRYSSVIFVRALLHVAATSPPLTRSSSDRSFKSALLNAFVGVLQGLPAEAKEMLTKYAPPWLAEILRSAQQGIDDSVAEQNRRFQQYEFEEKQMKLLEEEDRKRARQEEVQCRANREQRRRELDCGREQPINSSSSVQCAVTLKAAVKRPRDDMSSIMIAQIDPGSGGTLQQKHGPLLQAAKNVGAIMSVSQQPAAAAASSPPTALQRHLQELGERRVNEFIRVETINKTVEVLRRIAGSTDVSRRPPLTDDIIGHGRYCLAVDVPVIPQQFASTNNAAGDLYVASFLPHIALELRYELHQRFDEVMDFCRTREVVNRRGGDRSATTASTVRAQAINPPSGGGGGLPTPSSWITDNAMPVVCAGDVALSPPDFICLQLRVMLKVVPGATSVASLSAGLSEGDVALLLLPLPHIAASLPQLFNEADGRGIPEAWHVLGCVPKLCLVTSLSPGQRTAALTVFTSSTTASSSYSSSADSVAGGSNSGGDSNGTMSINFLHALRVFVLSQAHFYIKRLASLNPSLAAVNAIYGIQRKNFARTLLEPKLEARVSCLYHRAIERELVLSERWGEVSLALLLHHCLNDWQKRAIVAVLFAVAPGWAAAALKVPLSASLLPTSPVLFLIEGPPGTGKTQTIAILTLNLLQYLPKTARRVLVCAPSNCAVDEVLLRLRSLTTRVPQLGDAQLVRVGVRDNVDPAVLAASPPLFLDDCVGILADVFNTSCPAVTERVGRTGEADVLANGRRQQVRDQVLYGAHVVCSTLGSLSQLQRADFLFDVVIVDEASQGTEPDVLQALMLAKKQAVLVGDSKQLQPTVLCQAAAARGLKRSLLQRLLQQGHRSYLLRVQYRMHPDICAFPNRYFYGRKLLTHASVMTRQRSATPQALPLSTDVEKVPRLVFVDVQDGRMEWGRGRSLMNSQEADAVVLQMRRFRAMLHIAPKEFARRTGIITFYQAQKEAILRRLSREERCSDLQVATVDSFQGKEKDIIFISCVRAPHAASRFDVTATLGFLEDWHRINVSLTRAKEFCVVFGHAQTFRAAAAAALAKQQQKQEAQPPSESGGAGDGGAAAEEDDDVIHEATPPPPKSDDDPLVLAELVQYVAGVAQQKSTGNNAAAAMFSSNKNLHLLSELLLQSCGEQQP